ncbi:hypothetical protein [Halosimplex sp. J119]
MDATRRALLAAVPATVAVAGCSLASGSGSDDRPPYAVENESGASRAVALRVWKVGELDPLEDRPDSFRERFERAAAAGDLGAFDVEWRDAYDLTVDPGTTATPLDSSNATGLLYVQATADNDERIGVWAEVGDTPGNFFVELSVYESGMSATVGEY